MAGVREDPWLSWSAFWSRPLSSERPLKASFIQDFWGNDSGHFGGSGRGGGAGVRKEKGPLFGSSWLQVQGVMVVVSSWAKEPSGPGGASAVSEGPGCGQVSG